MNCHCYEIIFPENNSMLDQDEEYITLKNGDQLEKMLLHDYENIKDRFLSEDDATGFRKTICNLVEERLSVLESERYVHRLSLADKELYYYGIVGRKHM